MRVPRSTVLRAALGLVLGGLVGAVAVTAAPMPGQSAAVDGVLVVTAALGVAAALAAPVEAVPTVALLVYALGSHRLLPSTALLAVWAVRRAVAGRRAGSRPPRRDVAVVAILCLLVLVAVLSLVLSPFRGDSVLWTANIVLALVAVVSVGDVAREAALLRGAWPVIGSVVGAYAVLEALLRRNPVYGDAGIQDWAVYRPTASLGHPVYVGMFLACGCALAVGAFARGSRWWLLAAVLTGGGLVATLSRGAFVAIGLAVLVGAVLSAAAARALFRRFATVLVLGAGAAAAALPVLLTRFGSAEAHGSIVQRTRTYDIVFDAASKHLLLGTGGGTDGEAVGDAILSLHYIENWYLQILLGLGVVGLVTFAALVVALITTAVRRRDPSALMLTVAFCTVIATYNAADQAATPFLLALVVTVVLGGPAASSRRPRNPQRSVHDERTPPSRARLLARKLRAPVTPAADRPARP